MGLNLKNLLPVIVKLQGMLKNTKDVSQEPVWLIRNILMRL